MKQPLLLVVFFFIIISSVVAQQDNKSVYDNKIVYEFTHAGDDNVIINSMIEDMLEDDTKDPLVFITPEIFSSFAGFYFRRFMTHKREIPYNRKLIKLIDLLTGSVTSIQQVEPYVSELRLILSESNNNHLVGKAIDLYALIILQNPPKASDNINFTPAELFCLDAFNTLSRLSLSSAGHYESATLVANSLPLVNKILEQAPRIYNNSLFITDLLVLSNYHKSPVVEAQLTELVYKAFEYDRKVKAGQ